MQAAVTRGRRDEFAAFGWTGAVPDPQDPASVARSTLSWDLQATEPHWRLWDYYRALLRARRHYPVLGVGGKRRLSAYLDSERTLVVLRRGAGGAAALALLNVGPEARPIRIQAPPGSWRRLVQSGEERFGGTGPKAPSVLDVPRAGRAHADLGPWGAAVFLRERGLASGPTTAGLET